MKQVLKKGLLFWIQQLKKLSIQNILSVDGGTDSYYISLSLIYLGITLYNIFDYWGDISVESAVHVLPFLIIFILLLTKIKAKVDIIIDILIMIIIITISIVGEFSGITLLFLLIFRTKNKKLNIIFLFLCFLALSANTIIFENTIVEAFKTMVVFAFFLVKFYHIIYLPTKKLIEENKSLKNKLSITGPTKILTDDQIIQKYPFLYHPREDQYRRIKDIRMLSDGLSVKEISVHAGVEPNTISREFDDLKVNIGVFIDKKISTKEQLIKVCIELGIIEVNFIQR